MMTMKRFLMFLPFVLFIAGAFTACEEVEEEGLYANWEQRNEAFVDSIKTIAGSRFVETLEQIENVQVGEMFYLKNGFTSTNKNPQYIYCKKLVKNLDGERPLFLESAYVHYYGTLITGSRFDGTFLGYSATDQHIPNPPANAPTEFDSSVMFSPGSASLTSGWRVFLQYMRTGERWMIYIPYGSAYGESASGSIPGYSMLAFDVVMESVVPL